MSIDAYSVATGGIHSPVTPMTIATEGLFGKPELIIVAKTAPSGSSSKRTNRQSRPLSLLEDWTVQPFGPLNGHTSMAPTGLASEQPSLDDPSLEAVIERLRRLVALSASDNPNEAKIAAKQIAKILRERKIVDALARHLHEERTSKASKAQPTDRALRTLVETAGRMPIQSVQSGSLTRTRATSSHLGAAPVLLAGLAVLGIVLIASR